MTKPRSLGRRLLAAVAIAGLGLALACAEGVRRAARSYETETYHARGFELVATHDLGGRPGFKLAMQHRGERWILFASGLVDRGWSVLDVTDPARPALLAFVPGPANTSTVQVQVADGLLVAGLEKPPTELLADVAWHGFAWLLWDGLRNGFKLRPGGGYEEGVWLFDVSDPATPKRVGAWRSGGTGTHRNFYAGGRYAHLAANKPGFRGHQYVVLDLEDRENPREIGSWFDPEQSIAATPVSEREGYYLHGPAHVEGDRAYLPYGIAGAVILDVSDLSHPREVGRLRLPADLGSVQGVHTFLPLPGRRLAIANSEAHAESCAPDPGRSYTALVDIADETAPTLVSFFPEPAPPPGAPYRSFCERPGRAGPHNQHHHNHQPHLFHSDR